MTATSTLHKTDSSWAFLNRPCFLFRKVTERFLSSLMGLISIFRLPILAVEQVSQQYFVGLLFRLSRLVEVCRSTLRTGPGQVRLLAGGQRRCQGVGRGHRAIIKAMQTDNDGAYVLICRVCRSRSCPAVGSSVTLCELQHVKLLYLDGLVTSRREALGALGVLLVERPSRDLESDNGDEAFPFCAWPWMSKCALLRGSLTGILVCTQ
jgi:hypothetical protein